MCAALQPAKTPSGKDLAPLARFLIRNVRRHWPKTQIILRGDSHFARRELMELCEGLEGVDYIFACAKNSVLQGKEQVGEADRRAERICGPELGGVGRTHCEFLYGAGSWKTERRVVARVLATRREFMRRTDVCMEIDRRFVVTSLETGTPEEIYEVTYCMRAQAENLIKLHKSQLSSDRLPCAGAEANHLRLVVYSAAYMVMWTVRAAAGLKSEFNTVRERLIKIDASFRSTKSRIRVALSSSCPDQELFREVLARLRDKKFIDPAPPRRPARSAERTNPRARGGAVGSSALTAHARMAGATRISSVFWPIAAAKTAISQNFPAKPKPTRRKCALDTPKNRKPWTRE